MPTLVRVKLVGPSATKLRVSTRTPAAAESRLVGPDLAASSATTSKTREESEHTGACPARCCTATPMTGLKNAKVKPKRIRRPPVFKVTHSYHDYSQTSFTEYMRAHPNQKPARVYRHQPSFISSLHNLLEYARATNQESIVSWQPHGRAFIVHEPEEFAKNILPLFFRHTK